MSVESVRRRLIVVLGMHRSGTSAVTRGLEVLGVDLGNRLLPPVVGDNDKGYWEDQDILALNEEILAHFGKRWDSLLPISARELVDGLPDFFRQRALTILRQRFENQAVFGIKDPRLCLLLPFWQKIFAELKLDVGYIIAVRHPFSVARSIACSGLRGDIPPEKSHYLWLNHLVHGMEQTAGCRRVVIDYDRLLADPEKQLLRMSDGLSLPIQRPLQEYTQGFLDNRLRHCVSKEDMQGSDTLPAEIITAYEQLTALAADDSASTMQEVDAVFAQTGMVLSTLRPAFGYMDSREARVANLAGQLTERDGHIAGLNQAMAERDGVINALLSSTSWRVTKSLRFCGSQVLRVKLFYRAFTLASHHTGNHKKTFIKAMEILKKEGVRGVRSRIRCLLECDLFQPLSKNSLNLSCKQTSKEVFRHLQSVDIIVCVHNALDDVTRCLESIIRNTYPPYHIIIVDDGSDQETKEYLERFVIGQPATLIRNTAATGYTKAANMGMRASHGDFVLLLNSDTIVPPRWLDRLIQCANTSEQIGIVGPLSNTASWQSVPLIMGANGDWADNPLPLGWSVYDYANEVARLSPRIYPRVGFLNGFCLLIKRKLINDLGVFDEKIFGRGYGEENDYCLRAIEKRWQLAVADDCYIYHAQSKSYSHEKRTELAKLAGDALAIKHGCSRIAHHLAMTQPHPALHYMRQRCTDIEKLSSLRAEAQRRFEGRRVLFLLPAKSAGGGGNIVLLEAACMRAFGVDAWVANLEMHRPLFEHSYPEQQVPVLYLHRPEDLPKVALDFDAVIATLYLTVFWMEPLAALTRGPTLGYYIQDYEPDFFAEGSSNYQTALASYTAIPDLRLFTKTNWNQQTLHNKLELMASVIGPSLDIDRFHPAPIIRSAGGAIKILAMVRPGTPRRAPEATMRVLERLAQHFGDRIQITIFGVDPGSLELSTDSDNFVYGNLGEINARGVAAALAAADVFVDCSVFQAMGLTAMEAMASGVAVVGPVNGGLQEIIVDGHNGILVDTNHEENIVDAVSRLITDNELRARIQRNALEVLRYSPVVSSCKILDCLFLQDFKVMDKPIASGEQG